MTAQIHETLIVNGKATSMAFCPPLPEDHPRIRAVEPDDSPPDADSDPIEDLLLNSTACRRGYEGTWVIEGDRFFLAGLRGKWELLGDEPLFAEWFSGVLRIPQGKMLEYVHMGFGTVFEEEVQVKIERGMMVGVGVVDNRGTADN